LFSLLQVFLFLHDTKKYFCFVVWWFDRKKRQKKQRWKYVSIFFGIFLFSRRYVLLFFQRWREQSAVHFFSFLEVVTAYICNRQRTFLNIFFVFKFRKFRFWFFDAASVYRERARRFYIFFVVVCFFWLLMIFFCW